MKTAPIQSVFSAALLAQESSPPSGLRTWNGSDPTVRFAVYRNNMRASLARALADSFPVVQQLVGEEFFRAMALAFIQASPPRSPVLLEYGSGFADFVASFEPAASLPYLADVARLEHRRVQSFHAADAQPLQAQHFQASLAQADRLPGLRLQLHPSVFLLRSQFAVASLWQLHQAEQDSSRDEGLAALDLSVGEDLAVSRPGFEVRVQVLPPGAFECLVALQQGAALGDALVAGSDKAGFELQVVIDLLVHGELFTKITS